MKNFILKDRRFRILYNQYERRRQILRAIIDNLKLPIKLRAKAYYSLVLLPRNSSITRRRNRCVLTGRSRAVYRNFGLSRLRFRKLAWQGSINGVKKASWLTFSLIY